MPDKTENTIDEDNENYKGKSEKENSRYVLYINHSELLRVFLVLCKKNSFNEGKRKQAIHITCILDARCTDSLLLHNYIITMNSTMKKTKLKRCILQT